MRSDISDFLCFLELTMSHILVAAVIYSIVCIMKLLDDNINQMIFTFVKFQ